MGGGGTFYDRDTTDGYTRSGTGVSKAAEEKMSRSRIDAGLLPKGRELVSKAKSPVVYAFDVTGSMDNLPKIIFDKMPLIAGQIVENGYLDEPEVSLAAVGDIISDQAPIQVADFSLIKKLDDWLQRIWLEKKGGGQDMESYEYTAYFYARMCEMPKAVTPFFLITGDEDFRETLYKSDLERHFGGKHEQVEASQVFDELKKKFKGNVFLIHRKYRGEDEKIVRHWQSVLGKERVIRLGSDQAIADVTLGLFAIMTGSRTLDEYCEDMKTKRDKAQTDDRIAEVRKALQQLEAIAPGKKKAATSPAKGGSASGGKGKPKGAPKKGTGTSPAKGGSASGGKGKKPWQI